MAQLEENFFNTKYLLRVWHLGLGLLFFYMKPVFFKKLKMRSTEGGGGEGKLHLPLLQEHHHVDALVVMVHQ
jgi:hypothetical protein